MRSHGNIVIALMAALAWALPVAAVETLTFAPPSVDYAAVCKQDAAPLAGAKPDRNLPFKRKLVLAQRLIDGDTKTVPDAERAQEILEELIRSGPEFAVIKARLILARLLLYGRGVPQNTVRAVQLLEAVLPHKPYTAGADLGLHYEMQEQYARAAEYYRQAATAGNPGAYLHLSYLYRESLVPPPSDQAADEMLALAQNTFLEQLAKGRCNALVSIATVFMSRNYATRDEALAAQWLEAAVRAGQVNAMARLAEMYDHGVYVEHDAKRARDLWRRAAEGGNAPSMYQLAVDALRQGKIAEARALLEDAAQRGHKPSMKRLIKLHQGDYEAEPDYPQAAYWLQQAVADPQPDAELLFLMGEALESGQGVAQDTTQAFRFYERASRAGSVKALVKLGDAYRYGRGAALEPIKSYRFYRLAASHGNRDAMVRLMKNYRCGVARPLSEEWAQRWRERALYQNSWAVQKDAIRQALREEEGTLSSEQWKALRQRADKGDRIAMVLLAVAYHKKQDAGQAQRWQDKAIAAGKEQTEGLIALAEAWTDEWALGENFSRALIYLTKAEKRGSAKAAYRIGQLYESGGMGLSTDKAEAEKFYRKAAQAGYGDAMHKLAGLLLPSQEEKALQWLEKAAGQNEVEAMLKLARYYADQEPAENGKVQYWLDEARHHYPCKPEQRQQLATLMLELGNAYAAGIGVEASMEQARHWWQQAADAGSEKAAQLLTAE